MLQVSQGFHNAFKSEMRNQNIKIEITHGTTVYTSEHVNTLKYEAMSFVGDSFSIGSAPSNGVNIVFSEIITTFKEMDEIKVRMGITVNGTTEWVPLGTFYLSERADVDYNEKRTTIECLDGMVFMEGLYNSKLSYPASIKDVALEIANLAGMAVNTTSFTRLSTKPIKKIVGLTYRQAIGVIAQFETGYATFDRNGKLDIRTLSNAGYVVNPEEYFLKGLKKNDLKYTLGGISVKVDDDTTLTAGQAAGAQIELENSIMTQQLLDGIYTKLKTTNFYPFSLSWRGNPAVEAGDWIEMTDVNGNVFKGPIFNYQLLFDGGLRAESSANVEVQSSSTTAYKSPLSQKLEQIGEAIKGASGNLNYYGLEAPVEPKEGDIWFKPNGPDEELWQYVEIGGVLDWKLIISTADISKIEKEIVAIIAKAEKDKQEAIAMINAAIAESDRLVKEQAIKFTANLNAQKAQLETEITTSRDQAIAKAQTDINALETAQSGRMDGIKAEADAIKQTADKTKSDIDLAISNAGFTTLNDTFANMRKLANDARLEALKKVDTSEYTAKMQEIAGDLSKKADTLFVNQELANKVAQATYDKKVGELSTTVSGNATAIKKTETELTSKATKAEVDPLKTRLTTAESAISQTASQVAIKANQSDLDTATGRLTTAEAELTIQAGKIASKVSQTDFNKVDGRLVSAESTLTQQAGLIASKVSQTDFNKVAGRLTSAETAITQSGNEIALKASKTEAQNYAKEAVDGIKIGGRNLFNRFDADEVFQIPDYQGRGSFSQLTGFTFEPSDYIGEYFTVSAYVKSPNGATSFQIYNRNGKPRYFNFRGTVAPVVKGEWLRVFCTFLNTDNGESFTPINRLEFYAPDKTGVLIKNIQIEKGNKATDFTLAPEYFEANINELDGKITSNETAITANANQIKLKASQNDLNTVSGKVDSAQAELTVQAGKIASKVEQSVFNAANTRLSTAESTITQHANLINSKVSQTEFNKVDGRLKTAETSITQEAGKIETLLTRVSGAETSINSIKSTADSNKITIANHTGSISSIEQNVNGLQTTVANKANQSQVTQLANTISTKVSSSDVTDLIKNEKRVKDTRNDNKSPNWYFVNYARSVVREFKNRSIVGVATSGSYGIVVTEVPWSDPSGGRIVQTFYGEVATFIRYGAGTAPPSANEDGGVWSEWEEIAHKAYVESEIRVVQDAINLKVSKGDVSSQINIEANRTLISSGKLILDANTYIMGTTFANDVKAKSIEAVNANIGDLRAKILTADVITSTNLKVDSAMITKLKVSNLLANNLISDTIITDAMKANALTAITANITSIRSQVLVSNVVEATHLKADTAMINKLFATTALIDTLTTKLAFINSVKAIDISADRITAGTLNAANVRFINMDGSSLTTGTINAGNNSSWDLRTGLFQTADAYSNMRIENGGIKFYERRTGALIGGFQTNYYSSSNTTQFDFFTGDRVGVGLRFEGNTIQTTNRFNPGNIYLIPSQTGKVLVKQTDGKYYGVEAEKYSLNGYSELYETSDHSLEIYSPATITMRQGGGTYVFNADASRFKLQRDLNMSGFQIYGQSDRRLKTDIRKAHLDGLGLMRQYIYVNYRWKDRNAPSGVHLGLIAQDTPYISSRDKNGVWNISLSKQTMVHGVAIQQLDKLLSVQDEKIEMVKATMTRIDTYVTQHELEIKNLKKRINELEEKVT